MPRETTEAAMKSAHISGVSIATVNARGDIATTTIGTSNTNREQAITSDTVFGAASLSKPVFAYLILKLIAANQFTLDTKLSELLAAEGLRIGDIQFDDGLQLDPAEQDKANELTVGMALSHMTGLPIGANPSQPLQFEFHPNEAKYGYSGIGTAYLQKAIEAHMHRGLEDLANEYIFTPLKMHQSHFEPARFESGTEFAGEVKTDQKASAANSLHTTANDYAKFMLACMQDENLQYMFQPVVDMTRDDWAIREHVPQEDLEHTAWGFGFGVQTDETGKPVRAYHSGDMNEWRAWTAMDLETKRAVVFFANSHNGHILAEQIVSPEVELDHASRYFFTKYGFAKNVTELGEIDYFGMKSPAARFTEGMKLTIQSLDGYPLYPAQSEANFQAALQTYANYYQNLSARQKGQVSEVFWTQIKKIGTPIIEPSPDLPDQCEVYFLLPKDKLSKSQSQKVRKTLYLQGDIHGYDFTQDKQRVDEFENTGIMLKHNRIAKDAVITYRYVQVEPDFSNLSAVEIHGSEKLEVPPEAFFPAEKAEVPKILPKRSEHLSYDSSEIFSRPDADILDANTVHRPPYLGFAGAERILRVHPSPHQAKLDGQPINWSELLSPNSGTAFAHQQTLYSTSDGRLHEADPLYRQPNVGPDTLFQADKNSLYADCTRVTHVFTPRSGKIDQLIIVNDGLAYLMSDCMGQFEQMVKDGELPENTAFAFVTPLPALKSKIPADDPKASMPGMGERTVEYEHRINEYAEFLQGTLLPALEQRGLKMPNVNHRVMIGSSLSGTAGIYIGSKYPNTVGHVIAQSPSPSSREILEEIVADYEPSQPRAQMQLSCGEFEQPGYAENTNLPFARELKQKLKLPLITHPHGHQHLAWVQDLRDELPRALPSVTQSYRAQVSQIQQEGTQNNVPRLKP